MRVFIALPLPFDVQDQLEALQDGLSVGRPVAAEQMHITLAFFADVAPQPLSDLNDALEDVRAYTFDVEFSGLDVFGGAKPRLLAEMVRPSPELDHLHRAVQSAARRAGLEARRQRFRPHVTLFRFGARLPAHLPMALQGFLSDKAARPVSSFVADRMTMMQSTLGGAAPVYDLLAEYPFHPIPSGD